MARIKKPKVKKTRQTDWHLWNEVKLTVNPLSRNYFPDVAISEEKHKKTEKSGPKTNEKPAVSSGSSTISYQSFASSERSFASNLSTSGSLPTIEPRMHRHVRRGRIPIDASIDLHGMNQNVARLTLYNFIQDRSQRGDRTLLIITGKGQKKSGYGPLMRGGVLRQMLPVWLKDPQLVQLISGFEISGRHHGGEGAFYVRLKNLSKNINKRNK